MIKLEDIKCNFEIVELDDPVGLTLNKKSEDVKITIYERELINKIIDHNFNKKYRSLLYLIMNLNESEDTTETDTALALMKIEDLKNILLTKYFHFLSKELMEKYLNMLNILEQKIPIIKHNLGR